jgi:ribonuclease-3
MSSNIIQNNPELENVIKYSFLNKPLLVEALTHPSTKRQNKNFKDYQRLEFLGDKILGFVISEYIFTKYQSWDEGMMSRKHSYLVSGMVCHKVACDLNLEKYIITYGNQEDETGKLSKNILENVVEALIGAIFLDSGMDRAKKFILTFWEKYFTNITEIEKDPKTILQELCQKQTKRVPEYIIEEYQNNNKPYFEVKVRFDNYECTVVDTNKKSAMQIAAATILKSIKNNQAKNS